MFGLIRSASAQAINDNFVNATVITGAVGSTGGSTVGTTIEPGEPIHANSRGRSVWFRWTPPADGPVVIDTFGSGFDTVLAVYLGTDVSQLTPVAANDDVFFIGPSLVQFQALSSTNYYIAVDGFGIIAQSGPYQLNWNQTAIIPPPPTNSIGFSSPVYGVDENTPGFLAVSVTSPGGFTNASTIDYYTADGTAVGGIDYLAVSNTLVFAPGDTIKTFTIPILDDAVQNGNRTIQLFLVNPAGDAAFANQTNAVVTIIDDETIIGASPAGEFNIVLPELPLESLAPFFFTGIGTIFGTSTNTIPFYSVTENETFPYATFPRAPSVNDRSAKGALISVKRSGPAVGRVLVDYYTTNVFFTTAFTNIFGTNIVSTNVFLSTLATPGIDYEPVHGTLMFDDYQMSANFVVPILNSGLLITPTNSVLGLYRYFDVVITNPRPAPEEDATLITPTIGSTNRATVQIMKVNSFDGISIERATLRADEYDSRSQGGTNQFLSRTNFLDVDVIYPGGGAATVTLSIDVRRATRGPLSERYWYPLLAGSDYADTDASELGGDFGVFFDNSLFTDGRPPLTNAVDTAWTISTNNGVRVTNYVTSFIVSFTTTRWRDTFSIPIVSDDTVEFNEDLLIVITGVSPNSIPIFNQYANVTIVYNDQPAGAADREWNPEGVQYTNPR
ncbi:MAG TPA: Calx-beta domain-containing protein, partial [Candidatus Acidoferrum sp.]|nr:Calx-beta domain-containing protein [Candidatus Acidoferrum sp.]